VRGRLLRICLLTVACVLLGTSHVEQLTSLPALAGKMPA